MLKICEICKTEYRTNSGKQRFCGIGCRNKWFSIKQHGSSNSCWRDAQKTYECQHCGKTFNSYRKGAKYCTRNCYNESRAASKTLNCENCGKEFTAYLSEIKKGRRFCSIDCNAQWQSVNVRGANHPRFAQEEKKCKLCGKRFHITQSRELNGEGIFCSAKCYHKWSKGENARLWNGGKSYLQKCKWCGKPFYIWPSRKNRRRFCSYSCTKQWRSEKLSSEIGENSRNWQGGISFDPYPPEFNKPLRRRIRKRDQYICAICGNKGKSVHHIDYDKTNNNVSNLITLCKSCHGKTTGGNREYWRKILSEILKSRSSGQDNELPILQQARFVGEGW